jgi:hypothetical protein
MAEHAPKFEGQEEYFARLAKEVSRQWQKSGTYIDALEQVLDSEGIKDKKTRSYYRKKIGSVSGQHSKEMNPRGTRTKTTKVIVQQLPREEKQIVQAPETIEEIEARLAESRKRMRKGELTGKIREIEKAMESDPLLGAIIAEKQGLKKLKEELDELNKI